MNEPSMVYVLDKLQTSQTKTITLKYATAKTLKECMELYLGPSLNNSALYCNFTFDSYLCWPPTEPNTVVRQPCPKVRLSDPSQFASRRCGSAGKWDGRPGNNTGWTNYTSCLPANVQRVVAEIIKNDNKYNIIQGTRYLEIFGFVLSLICLVTSLYILSHFSILRNTRTKIHRNLFGAMIIQVLSRLVIYFDQLFNESEQGIAHTPVVCEICYVIMEWAYTSMFSWMLVEGMYLRYLNSHRLMRNFPFKCYCCLAWGVPIVFTTIWAGVTLQYYKNDCWFGYNLEANYWIMQAPRILVIMINLVILMFILKEIYSKLDEEDTETRKLKIGLKAALILIPLLGIINILNMVDIPVSTTSWKFAIWSYTTHFLSSFQGSFLALFYCFLNREVRKALKRKLQAVRYCEGINKRRANKKRKRALNQLFVDSTSNLPPFFKNVPPPPFFHINSSIYPTIQPKCGCMPRINLHQSDCPLARPFVCNFDNKINNSLAYTSTRLEDGELIHGDTQEYVLPPLVSNPCSTQSEENVVRLVIRPDIHDPPAHPPAQRSESSGIDTELKVTTI